MEKSLEQIRNDISTFLTIYSDVLLNPEYKDDGTVYFKNLPNGISVVLSIDDEKCVEASIRVTNSSYFVDDWDYVDEGSFVGLSCIEEIDGIVTYFMDYVKNQSDRSYYLDEIMDYMDDNDMEELEYMNEEKGIHLWVTYYTHYLDGYPWGHDFKVIEDKDKDVTYNVDPEHLHDLIENKIWN